MKSIYLLLFFCLIKLNLQAQFPNYQWAKRIGGDTNSYNYSFETKADFLGNVYTVGYFSGTSDFDPGPNTFSLTFSGGFDGYITKLSPTGNFLWAKKINGSNSDGITAMDITNKGDILLTGYFTGTADFDPGPGTFTLSNLNINADPFILKLDSGGNFIWAKHLYGPSYPDGGKSIKVDSNGNIYITGDFRGPVDFDPSSSVFTLSPSSNFTDIFILKLDSLGNFIWVKGIGGALDDLSYSINLDSFGNCLTTGYYTGSVDFDPSSSTYTVSSNGNKDIFLLKLDPLGNFMWVKNIGNIGDDQSYDCVLDANNNIFYTGIFDNTLDFDPGPNAYLLGNTSSYTQFFISKLDANGNFLWANSISGPNFQKIDIDSYNNVYASGRFNGTVDFDPGLGTYTLSTTGNFDTDGFIAMFNNNGSFVWAGQLSGNQECVISSIDLNNVDDILLSGTFRGICDFDPNYTTVNQNTLGGSDLFVEKLGKYSLGIANNKIENTIHVYPNPSSDIFNFKTNHSFLLQLTNVFGQELLVEKRNSGEQKIDVQNLSNGIYFLKITENDMQYNFKIIKE